MSGRPADISTVVNAVGHERMAQQRIGTAGKNIYVSASAAGTILLSNEPP